MGSQSRTQRVLPVLPPIRTNDEFVASPSVPEFHRIGRTQQSQDCLARFADYHRRFGFSPTPEHVLCGECSAGR